MKIFDQIIDVSPNCFGAPRAGNVSGVKPGGQRALKSAPSPRFARQKSRVGNYRLPISKHDDGRTEGAECDAERDSAADARLVGYGAPHRSQRGRQVMSSQFGRTFAFRGVARLPAELQADQDADCQRNRKSLRQFDSFHGRLSHAGLPAASKSKIKSQRRR